MVAIFWIARKPKFEVAGRSLIIVLREEDHAASVGGFFHFKPSRRCRLAQDCVRGTAPFRTRLDNNGQTSAKTPNCYAAFDPSPTSPLQSRAARRRQDRGRRACRLLRRAEPKAITCNRPSFHRACERPGGPYVSGTRIDFDRPICIGPTHCCDAGSDRSRLTRTPAQPPTTRWKESRSQAAHS